VQASVDSNVGAILEIVDMEGRGQRPHCCTSSGSFESPIVIGTMLYCRERDKYEVTR